MFHTNETEINVTRPGFSDRLLAAGTNTFGGSTVPTYDRYTFYRLLAELGSDSTPDSGKINLNYSNAVVQTGLGGIVTNIVIAPGAETNFVPWTATNFFMAAADRLLRIYTTNWFQSNPSNYLATFFGVATNYYYNYYSNSFLFTITNSPTGLGMTNIPFGGMTNQIPAFGITNIPVVINGNFVYSPAVNRLLQLTANIYDATTNRYYDNLQPPTPLPTVFRPIFYATTNLPNFNGVKNVYICGFSEVTSAYEADQPLSVPYDLRNTMCSQLGRPGNSQRPSRRQRGINVFGVPMIIRAKKGLPNFNEFYMESIFQLTRKLMATRQRRGGAPATIPTNPFWGYYAMYNMSLNNQFEVECWNSYRSNYTRPIDIYVTNFLVMTLTNDENNFSCTTNLIAGASCGFPTLPTPSGRAIPTFTRNWLAARSNFAGDKLCRRADLKVSLQWRQPHLSTNLNLWYEIGSTPFGQYPQPHWVLTVTNNLQVAMVDDKTGRLIDYVQLSGPNSIRDLTAEIMSLDTVNGSRYNDLWDTNLTQGIPNGFAWQFNVSQASTYSEINSYWNQQDSNRLMIK